MASSSITYKAVVMPAQKRRDGSFNIKIRVTFKRVSRYLSTNLTATAKDLNSKGELKGAALIAANRLISQFYQYASELNYFSLQEMEVDDVLRYIRRKARYFRLLKQLICLTSRSLSWARIRIIKEARHTECVSLSIRACAFRQACRIYSRNFIRTSGAMFPTTVI